MLYICDLSHALHTYECHVCDAWEQTCYEKEIRQTTKNPDHFWDKFCVNSYQILWQFLIIFILMNLLELIFGYWG